MSKLRRVRDTSRVRFIATVFMGSLAGATVWSLFAMFVESSMLRSGNAFWAAVFFGGLIANAYALIFRSAHRSGAFIGLHLSIFHYAFSAVALGFTRAGFFGENLGLIASVLIFVSHLIYGIILGVLFDWDSIRNQYQLPLKRTTLSESGLPAR